MVVVAGGGGDGGGLPCVSTLCSPRFALRSALGPAKRATTTASDGCAYLAVLQLPGAYRRMSETRAAVNHAGM